MATPPLPLRFVMSATRVDDLPPTRGEVAIVGRSNVGKSSVINSIANRKGLAKVSKTPGRTQLLNLFELPDGTSVLDLPGYGFANAPASVRATWPEMIEGYLLGRDQLRTVIALIDAEVGPTKNDTQTLAWLRSHGLPVQVIATKHDKVKPSQRDKRRKDLAEGCMLTPADVLWVSSAKNVNIDELRHRILGWLDPVDDWPPAAPTRKERAESRAAAAASASASAEAADDPGADEDDDEDEWN
ncbi:ribosome biogenesis GTP-binding protein YihA/YsxC [Aquihabitans sp. McL0605]|uniref:ribosome biogenesis GTP-binding protein YihA/YsxC n=1 Tax=Aquihabitans sp. McL0605 TaxID=3415671 RepID=UPI003CF2A0BF